MVETDRRVHGWGEGGGAKSGRGGGLTSILDRDKSLI